MYKFVASLLLISVFPLRFAVADGADTIATPDDMQDIAVITASLAPKDSSATHLSLAGLGSLYWAVHNPARAWRVLAPIQPEGVAYAGIRARCVEFTKGSSGQTACP